MINKTSVQIIIPIYQSILSGFELQSIKRCFSVLSKKYPVIFAKPESLQMDWYNSEFKNFGVECFNDLYFEDIRGYNRLMLSSEFYERFIDSEYILIYQPDSYVFRDELDKWCEKGYDYIGAPWLPKQKYNTFYYKAFSGIKASVLNLLNKKDHSCLFYKVGNGGFSLRNTRKFLEITISDQDTIQYYIERCDHDIYNEDVFWALEVNKKQKRLKIPSYKEALSFAFDKCPEEAYLANNQQLPFGCHGWHKKQMLDFWKKFITE